MRRVSGKRKVRDKRGKGSGADWNPWIHTREVSSSGTKSLLVDWKHGRQIHTLSRNETYFYYIMRWDDTVIDINEQYPLDRNRTERIAEALSIKHPRLWNDPEERMTTDFLVTKADGNSFRKIAFSIKDSYGQVFGDTTDPKVKRLVEEQTIEMSYWRLQGVDFKIIFGDRDINKMLARNIELVVNHYSLRHVHSIYEFASFLIANKYIIVPMDKDPIDIVTITNTFLSTAQQVENWLNILVKNNMLDQKRKIPMKVALLTSVDEKPVPTSNSDENEDS